MIATLWFDCADSSSRERRRFGHGPAHEDLLRRLAAAVVLQQERPHDLVVVGTLHELREEAARAERAPAAKEHHGDADDAVILGHTDGVEFPARARHELLRLDVLQPRELVAILRRALELQRLRRLLHALCEPRGDDVALAFEKQHGVLEIPRVVLLADQTDAGRRAALDLMLHAGPAAVLEIAVLALAQLKQLVELIQRLAHRACVRIWAEQPPLRRPRPAIERQAREAMLRLEQDVRIALIVAQHDVEAWPMLLDEVVLEHQRFDFGTRDRNLEPRNRPHHRDRFCVVRAAALEIASDAPFQVACFADVDDRAGGVEHAVDARPMRQVREHGRGIEGDCGLLRGSNGFFHGFAAHDRPDA